MPGRARNFENLESLAPIQEIKPLAEGVRANGLTLILRSFCNCLFGSLHSFLKFERNLS